MWKQLIAVSTASVLLSACGAGSPVLRSPTTGELAPCPSSPHCVSSLATNERHAIEPLRYVGSPVAAREKLARVLGRMASLGYAVVLSEGDYLRATHTSKRMKYVDDMEFVFSQSQVGVIHVRSSSRIGYADGGANRRHVEEVRRAFDVAKS